MSEGRTETEQSDSLGQASEKSCIDPDFFFLGYIQKVDQKDFGEFSIFKGRFLEMGGEGVELGLGW